MRPRDWGARDGMPRDGREGGPEGRRGEWAAEEDQSVEGEGRRGAARGRVLLAGEHTE